MADDRPSVVDRFWAKVQKRSDGCWEWTARRFPTGYGSFYFEGGPKYAHRVSWVLHRGVIPDGQCVLHRCDRRWCVNPEHLFVGTPKDNTADMVSKGRNYRPPRRKWCANGHIFNDENIAIYGDGKRRCRQCEQARGRARYRNGGRERQRAYRQSKREVV